MIWGLGGVGKDVIKGFFYFLADQKGFGMVMF